MIAAAALPRPTHHLPASPLPSLLCSNPVASGTATALFLSAASGLSGAFLTGFPVIPILLNLASEAALLHTWFKASERELKAAASHPIALAVSVAATLALHLTRGFSAASYHEAASMYQVSFGEVAVGRARMPKEERVLHTVASTMDAARRSLSCAEKEGAPAILMCTHPPTHPLRFSPSNSPQIHVGDVLPHPTHDLLNTLTAWLSLAVLFIAIYRAASTSIRRPTKKAGLGLVAPSTATLWLLAAGVLQSFVFLKHWAGHLETGLAKTPLVGDVDTAKALLVWVASYAFTKAV